jgi:hypothetical protein
MAGDRETCGLSFLFDKRVAAARRRSGRLVKGEGRRAKVKQRIYPFALRLQPLSFQLTARCCGRRR